MFENAITNALPCLPFTAGKERDGCNKGDDTPNDTQDFEDLV